MFSAYKFNEFSDAEVKTMTDMYYNDIMTMLDYLDGDIYFRTKREGQNLDRCRTQFKLVEDMEKALPEMQKIIKKYSTLNIIPKNKCIFANKSYK